MARATSSLPVPVSPRSSTGTSRSATRRISCRTRSDPLALADQAEPVGNAGGLGRHRVQQQDHPVGQLDDDPPLDLARREGAPASGDRHAVRHQPGAAPFGGDGDRPVLLPRDPEGRAG